jgi:hypothetical protein
MFMALVFRLPSNFISALELYLDAEHELLSVPRRYR